MIRLLRFIITGSWHEHKWELEKEWKAETFLDDDKYPYKTARYFIQKCSVCGKLKLFKAKN